MQTKIIQIGNSRGIRIPKTVLEQVGIEKDMDVDMQVDGERIVISPLRHPRQGWAEAFRKMHEKDDDRLLDSETEITSSSWDNEEWEWE